MTSNIVIYQSRSGDVEIDVTLDKETLWLSQKQMGVLFGVGRQAITKHLQNIFTSQELQEKEVCSVLEHTAKDGKKYKTKFYNLDAVISVGYRVNSSQATQFRIWSTRVLKERLVQGYSLHSKRLAERGVGDLQQAIDLLQKTLVHQNLVTDVGTDILQLITQYAKTWWVLRAYDEDVLVLPTQGRKTLRVLGYDVSVEAIVALRD